MPKHKSCLCHLAPRGGTSLWPRQMLGFLRTFYKPFPGWETFTKISTDRSLR